MLAGGFAFVFGFHDSVYKASRRTEASQTDKTETIDLAEWFEALLAQRSWLPGSLPQPRFVVVVEKVHQAKEAFLQGHTLE